MSRSSAGNFAGSPLGADDIDGFLAHPGAACRPDLGGPHVGALALTRGDKDGEAAVFGRNHAVVRAEEVPEIQHALGELGAMEQHAERPTYLPEHLQHAIDDVVVFGRHVGFASNGGDSWHEG